MAGTGLFVEALDDLATTLATISGLPVVRDPRNLTPGCVVIQAPTWQSFSSGIVQLTVPVTIVSSGPANRDALDQLLSIAATIIAKKVGNTNGRPVAVNIGGTDAPGYELTIEMQAQA